MFESNDTFVEEAVKVVELPQERAKKTGLAVCSTILLLAVVTLALSPILKLILVVLLIVFSVITIIAFSNKNIEYEYDYTNGSLEIAKIIDNSKRKSVVTVESAEVKMIAAIGTNESLKFDHVQLKTYDCSAHDEQQKDYILVAHNETKGNDYKVLFTPSDKLLTAMEKYNKRDIYRA